MHIFKINFILFLFLAALGLRCYAQAFSSYDGRGLLFVAMRRLLIAVASLCCGAQARGSQASVVMALGLHNCGLWALEHRRGSCGALA